jgi:hypothetical protein
VGSPIETQGSIFVLVIVLLEGWDEAAGGAAGAGDVDRLAAEYRVEVFGEMPVDL